jgi:hypothetical protein
MEAADQEINFRAVSSEARVSTAWLYNQQELRDRITRLRKSQSWGPPAKSDRERRESLSRKSIVETLRLRIKKLEEKNRELTELLEVAYGVIAETSRAACSITSDSTSPSQNSEVQNSARSVR